MLPLLGVLCLLLCAPARNFAQSPVVQGAPIAIVPLDAANPDQAPTVTGALEVTANKAIIVASGSVTSSSATTNVTLPRRGTLRVCASTTVNLAVDSSVPAGNMPGLLMAMDHGAIEMSFANLPAAGNADILMTPDFRILVSGPGASEVKVRLGSKGDTCVDNTGKDAPYVVVTSLFATGLYSVQPGQRVMFEHGSLDEVVDQEKEPCGCPPAAAKTQGNEFPLAQSEGLAPMPAVAPPAAIPDQSAAAQQVPPLVYDSSKLQEAANAAPATAPSAAQPPAPEKPPTDKKKPGMFARLGQFFKKIFGAE